ncbi:uncharacterized protein V1510DRAFT_366306 [Dipodascopsis tothii]|uniref:uncharacterized protein n=1 Tax=Dipodascopsis tothii TaxID=44089 RepID=UPI0034CFE39B
MFKFDFSGEDIDADVGNEGTNGSSTNDQYEQNSGNNPASGSYQAEIYDVSDLLVNLPSRMSYSLLPVSAECDLTQITNRIPRREVFDIRLQIMAEEEVVSIDDGNEMVTDHQIRLREEAKLLLSNTEDLRTEFYEGGLKSWEGAGDLVEYLHENSARVGNGVLELGCGSALPSIYLFQKLVHEIRSGQKPTVPIVFFMADYNFTVLRFMTASNFILAYYNIVHQSIADIESSADVDMSISGNLVAEFLAFLNENHISIKFISGAWDSHRFASIMGSIGNEAPLRYSYVFASETIYSPATLPSFTTLLLDSVTFWKLDSTEQAMALVAAKEIYFGVGGSVREFMERVAVLKGKAEIAKRITGKYSGVARVIMNVSK